MWAQSLEIEANSNPQRDEHHQPALKRQIKIEFSMRHERKKIAGGGTSGFTQI